MKTVLGGITAAAICFATLWVKAAETDMSVTVDCADTFIMGAPSIMTVTILNRNPVQSPFPGPMIDFASELKQGVALAFKFESDSRPTIQVGYPAYGLPEVEFGRPPPGISLNIGEPVTYTFDLSQLLFGGELRGGKNVPVGKYRVTAMFYSGAWKSIPKEITIREPTPDEKRFLEAIQKQGIGEKWFPAVITDDNLEVPDDIPLPAETARLRDFIKVLRLAVRNPDAALKQIEETKGSWGYLEDVVTELEYECVVKVKGKDSTAARSFRRTLDDDPKTKGRLVRLEKAGGLLDHFAEIGAAQHRGKRK